MINKLIGLGFISLGLSYFIMQPEVSNASIAGSLCMISALITLILKGE